MGGNAAQQLSEGAIILYWWISLAIGGAVVLVVALLLNALARTAEQIDAGAAEIWTAGKLIANNTIHIPLLGRTNQLAAGIVQAAERLLRATERLPRDVAGDPAA